MDTIFAKTVTYQCPNCNAALEFDNEIGKLRCFYCDSVFDEAQIKSLFAENEQMKLNENEPEITSEQKENEDFSGCSGLYTCPNCGAGVFCDSLTASTKCHFCHTPLILSGRLSGEFKPNMIIPFSTTRENAESKFREYIKGKFLLPRGFKSEAQIKNISALYVPYWLKSGLTDASMTAQGKKIRTWRTGDTVHTNTKLYRVYREAEIAFIRVPCDGSRRIDDSLMESIEPFNYGGLKSFSMSYLSGCAAEKYDVTKEEAAKRIDERIRQAAEDILRKSAGEYNSLEQVRTSTSFEQQTYVYALLPVWFLNYTYKGKDYEFAMNGQTGTMFGKLPISGIKTFLFGAGVFLLSTILAFLIGGVCAAL
jgi:hypothetical protein